MIPILSQISPYKYNKLGGKNITVEFVCEPNNKQRITGVCLVTPPPLIICDLYQDISPSLRILSPSDRHIVYHIPVNKITNIYLTCEDNTSKTYASLVCKHKKVCSDLERHIITFINGWTHDVKVH